MKALIIKATAVGNGLMPMTVEYFFPMPQYINHVAAWEHVLQQYDPFQRHGKR